MILVKILEQIFIFFHLITSNYGISIILLSLTVTIMMLPLFWIAEKLQNKERGRKAILQPALDKIRNLKNKQEKFFYTKEIYKQHNYSPYYSLTGLLGLLIQIPFFIAAFVMLKDFNALSDVSFGLIHDLFSPDSLFKIHKVSINVLPFLMTAVNLLAVYLYTKRMDNNEKIQLIIIAFVFLILLYELSSALVLYWTMNSVFSIGKNWLMSKVNKENKGIVKNSLQHEGLLDSIFNLYKKYQREIIIFLLVWAIYLSSVGIMLNFRFGETFTSTIAIIVSIMLLDILIINIFLKTSKQKRIERIIVRFICSIIILSPFAIIFHKYLSYDIILRSIIIFQLIFLFLYFIHYNKVLSLKMSDIEKKLLMFDNVILLLLAFPLIIYLFSNKDYFSLTTGIIYFLFLLGVPYMVFLLITFLFKKYLSEKFFFAVLISIFFTNYTLPTVTKIFKLTSETNVLIHILLLGCVSFIVITLYFKSTKTLRLLSIILVCVAVIQGVLSDKTDNNREVKEISKTYNYLSGLNIKDKPDIYFLIYDAYVAEKQMDYYGIDNHDQMQFLKDNDFVFYDDVYTVGCYTLGSVASVLEMDYTVNSRAYQLRKIISGNSTVDNIFQKNGYKTHYLLTPYFFRGNHEFGGDFMYPPINSDVGMYNILSSILLGQFKFDNEFQNDDYDEKNKTKHQIILKQTTNPKFLYSHSIFPGHSANAGYCRPNETDLYEERLQIANNEMRDDIEAVLNSNRDAIIIIAGDHGAFLTGDCTDLDGYEEEEVSSVDLADRYGMFLAIKYPDNNYLKYNKNIKILQDVFFSIFAGLFETDSILNYSFNNKPSCKGGKYIPVGAIENGIVMYGRDKGKKLYSDIE